MQKTSIRLPERLTELRDGKTQSALAREIGVIQQTYARWELGDRQPKLQDLAALAAHFGVTTDWLLGLTDERGERQDCTRPPDEATRIKILEAEVAALKGEIRGLKFALDAAMKGGAHALDSESASLPA